MNLTAKATPLLKTDRLKCWSLGLATLAVLGLAVLGLAAPGYAQVVYSATDSGAGPGDAHPNADAKAAQFDLSASSMGAESLITFETAPVGDFTNLTAAPGVTLTGANFYGKPLTIADAPTNSLNPAGFGYNTTPGGKEYLDLVGGNVTFNFATPIQAFGAYFTGVDQYDPLYLPHTVVTFSDGTSQSFIVPPPPGTIGGATFAGFTDPGKSISRVVIDAGTYDSPRVISADFIGLDDVRFVPAAAVPEPCPLALLAPGLLLGLLPVGPLARGRRRKC